MKFEQEIRELSAQKKHTKRHWAKVNKLYDANFEMLERAEGRGDLNALAKYQDRERRIEALARVIMRQIGLGFWTLSEYHVKLRERDGDNLRKRW
jgi:hypothetical protein